MYRRRNMSVFFEPRFAKEVHYGDKQPRLSGHSFDFFLKVGLKQKNIFFPPFFFAALVCSIKDVDYRFLPHG